MENLRLSVAKLGLDRERFGEACFATTYYGSNGVATATIDAHSPNHVVVPTSILAQSQWRNTRALNDVDFAALMTTIDNRQVFLQVLNTQGAFITSIRLPLSEVAPADRRYQQDIEISSILGEMDNTGMSFRIRFDGKSVDEFQSIVVGYKQVDIESLLD